VGTTFQAGHASSILVTRSTVKPLVKGVFCAAVMLLRDCPPRSGHYAGHWFGATNWPLEPQLSALFTSLVFASGVMEPDNDAVITALVGRG
jgi:hypothetical protein